MTSLPSQNEDYKHTKCLVKLKYKVLSLERIQEALPEIKKYCFPYEISCAILGNSRRKPKQIANIILEILKIKKDMNWLQIDDFQSEMPHNFSIIYGRSKNGHLLELITGSSLKHEASDKIDLKKKAALYVKRVNFLRHYFAQKDNIMRFQIISAIDLNDIKFGDIMQNWGFLLEISGMIANLQPESTHQILVFGAENWIESIWDIAKKLDMVENTRHKVHFVESLREKLSSMVEENQIPERFGESNQLENEIWSGIFLPDKISNIDINQSCLSAWNDESLLRRLHLDNWKGRNLG